MGKSAIEHLARACLGRQFRDGLFAMLSSYFDDSEGKGFVVIGGWISSVKEWDDFEIDWKLFLASYKVPYFHMKEYAHSVGPYEKWKNAPEFRKRFIHDAWEIIRSHVYGGFVSFVQDIVFNRVNRAYELDEHFPTPYSLVSRFCMEWVQLQGIEAKKEYRYVFDDPGSGKKCSAIQVADLHNKLPAPIFEHSRDIVDRKAGLRHGMVQLQAADFLAWEMRKFTVDHALVRGGSRSMRFSMKMFAHRKPDTFFFSEQRLIETCKIVGAKQRKS